ncbi:zinc-binding dehydrogenase [Paenibacillus sp. DXFW5]|uniref:Zinc-binding dehydrogenase n=1 Tax=Paenibacillus rhizolycopersici TaxID=2780073 RepID=A0ABS2HAR8_9BACL|nr:zinc-binding dehydrogenase [Paenibacillus rhizolycopersici]MBM6996664.1 zinc-binding dehydrogenase [Paenibacillus rhizolycopersici]
MKALILPKPGKPDTLEIAELPMPVPGPGEIRVRVHAAGLNPIDYKVSPNGNPAWVYPFVLGIDVAGVVDTVGEGVTTWKTGDRVAYMADFTRPGGFAEYTVTVAHTVAAIPDGVSFTDAAAFPCAGLTAYQILTRKMNIRSGQSLLVHAGAGGVGGYAIQLAKLYGASPILATASPQNADYVRSLGADEVIDYNSDNVQERVMAITNGVGVDLIINSLNRATAHLDLDTLAFGGQLACIAGAPETVADFQPSSKSFTLHKLMIAGAYGSGSRKAEEDLAVMAGEFMALLQQNKVDSLVQEVIQLEQVPDALIRLSQRHVRGKIVAEL